MLTFDNKGYLKPYKVNEITKDEFFNFFVENLDNRDQRKYLFSHYLLYIDFIKRNFSEHFFQWVGGSFITDKSFPNDIDIVTFLPHDLLTKKSKMIHQNMRTCKSRFNVDGFFAPICKWNHRFFEMSKKIELDWFNNYGTSREDETGVRHPKGIIKINW